MQKSIDADNLLRFFSEPDTWEDASKISLTFSAVKCSRYRMPRRKKNGDVGDMKFSETVHLPAYTILETCVVCGVVGSRRRVMDRDVRNYDKATTWEWKKYNGGYWHPVGSGFGYVPSILCKYCGDVIRKIDKEQDRIRDFELLIDECDKNRLALQRKLRRMSDEFDRD